MSSNLVRLIVSAMGNLSSFQEGVLDSWASIRALDMIPFSAGHGACRCPAIQGGCTLRVKVRLDQIRGGWYEIVLVDGSHGWVRTDWLEIS